MLMLLLTKNGKYIYFPLQDFYKLGVVNVDNVVADLADYVA